MLRTYRYMKKPLISNQWFKAGNLTSSVYEKAVNMQNRSIAYRVESVVLMVFNFRLSTQFDSMQIIFVFSYTKPSFVVNAQLIQY